MKRHPVILSALLLTPTIASASPAITCHCFTDRSYDPAKPTQADPYFLAAAQNSFFAVFFAVDKKTIVLKKQGGAGNDDMWIAYWIAAKGGENPELLLAAHNSSALWKDVPAATRTSAKLLGERFAAELLAGASSAQLAQLIVDDALLRNRIIDGRDLGGLRKERATNQEVILTALLARKSGRSGLQIYQEVKLGQKSWGAQLAGAKIAASGMQAEFGAFLKP
jgi:hypothetical protein